MQVIRVLLVLAVFGGITFYVWRRLVRDTGLRGPWRLAGTAAVISLVLPMMIVVATSRGGGPPVVHGAAAWPVFIGWAALGLTFVGLLAIDLGRLIVWIARKLARRPAPMDPGRRQALARMTGGAVAGVVLTGVGTGSQHALAEAHIMEETFWLDRLPRALDGFTLVQLTDVHIGMTIGRDFVEDMVERANAIGGDAIVITGDLVDGSVAELRDDAAPLRALRAKHGVYFVTGNHEYYSGADAWIVYLATLGIRTLRNERVELSRDGATFELAGIDDYNAYGPGHGPDLAKALAGRDRSRALVLLAHQPRQVHDAANHGVNLQLSGHTHGGQVWPWHYIVALQQGGLIAGRYTIGTTQLYVSRGTGYWGPPVRVLAPAEITKVVLRTPR